ncbi:MAG TPA: ABC transporter substrate-binding protein [Streptosporangiaceae bacterium]|nr:ABC transporter substrate-binding protein [Streptosporangiaceae bacterium]
MAALAPCALALALLAACQPGSSQATAVGRGASGQGGAVVVASFNFTESELLAAIYGLAIRHAGIPVRLELDLGPRELVQPALEQGLVDVVPEYLGTALTSLQPPLRRMMPDPAAVRAALARALARWHVRVMAPAAAQDQNGIVVTEATARRLSLHKVSDLRRAAGRLILGGSPECPDRPYCLPGLRTEYGLDFAGFLPFDTEPQRVIALREGVVDVAVLNNTDGNLASGDLVLLSDDRHLQPAENVVPVITSRALARYGKRLADAVNVVSARLTSQALLFMDWRVEVARADVMAEARAWLERHGVLPRPG